MPTYEVELNGQNFWLEVDGVPRRMGFYALRYVDAPTPQDAAHAAVKAVRKHASLANLLNERSDPPKVYAEDIIELSESPESDEREPDLSFYPEDDDDGVQ
jgi:hypothetical protein